jgi:hypothetical protein
MFVGEPTWEAFGYGKLRSWTHGSSLMRTPSPIMEKVYSSSKLLSFPTQKATSSLW